MKIPKGMDETEVVNTILKISKKLAHKYTFASYEAEDIEQEAFLIGITGLSKYDQSRPLENFMYVHINNRLKTFKRDNYYRLEHGAAEKIQKTKNRQKARQRVFVEHAIGHLKTMRIVKDKNRNKKLGYRELVFRTAVQLHNFRCAKRRTILL